MASAMVAGGATLLLTAFFTRRIFTQLRTGRFRPRGSDVYKTRRGDPVWFWSSIVVQIAVITMAIVLFSVSLFKNPR